MPQQPDSSRRIITTTPSPEHTSDTGVSAQPVPTRGKGRGPASSQASTGKAATPAAAPGDGGTDEVWRVVQQHQAALVRYAAHLTSDAELARDIVQDVFMRFLREGPERLVGREAQWLYTVCRNRAYDMMRKSNRTVPLDDAHAATLTCSSTPSPSAAAESGDSNRRVALAMQTLAPRMREVVMLKFQAGLSYKEIADVTKLTVNHVGVLLHHALQKLRDELRDDLALEGSVTASVAPVAVATATAAASTSSSITTAAALAAKWSTK